MEARSTPPTPYVQDLNWQQLQTIQAFEQAACQMLPEVVFQHFAGGSGQEQSLGENQKAFGRYQIWPRVLIDVSSVDPSTTVLGTRIRFPVFVAPTARHALAHPEGELASAQGTAEGGTIFTLSTVSTHSLEEVAQASSGPKWFQLYIHQDRGITRTLVEKAWTAGYQALVVTVDTPVLSNRLADQRNHFSRFVEDLELPIPNLISREEWQKLDRQERSQRLAHRQDPSVTWKDIEWLQSLSPLPIVLKGILRKDDAQQAAERGIQGLIVSNHGGRQLDGVPATLDALPGIVEATKNQCEIYLDGGIRWGTDVFKALAMGARAVLVGRPVLWGLTVGGRAGVARVLELLYQDLLLAMTLAGCPTVTTLSSDMVRPI